MQQRSAHQSTRHRHCFLFDVANSGGGADSSRLAASRKDDIPHGLAGSHPRHPDARQIKAQDSADGNVSDYFYRSPHEFPSAVGRNRAFSQGLYLLHDLQAAVLLDHQISHDIHHRIGVNETTLLIVKIKGGIDRKEVGRPTSGDQVHEHHLGGDAIPVSEMCKVQGGVAARVGDFNQAARTILEWFAMDGIDTEFLEDFRGLLFLRAEDGSSFAPIGIRFGKRGESLSVVPVIRVTGVPE